MEFIVPKTKKKITQSFVDKIKQGDSKTTSYNAVLGLAKLFESEIEMMAKIKKQLLKFKSKEALDLQITQLYQCLDMKGTGVLNRKAL